MTRYATKKLCQNLDSYFRIILRISQPDISPGQVTNLAMHDDFVPGGKELDSQHAWKQVPTVRETGRKVQENTSRWHSHYLWRHDLEFQFLNQIPGFMTRLGLIGYKNRLHTRIQKQQSGEFLLPGQDINLVVKTGIWFQKLESKNSWVIFCTSYVITQVNTSFWGNSSHLWTIFSQFWCTFCALYILWSGQNQANF